MDYLLLGQLFVSFFKIGWIGFGGGYAMIAPMRYELIISHHWLTNKQFLDSLAIGQITPGPIAISATFAGYKIAGISGSVIATIGVFSPSIVVMIILAKIYYRLKDNPYVIGLFRGVYPAVVGLLIVITWKSLEESITNVPRGVIPVLVFLIIYKFKLDPKIGILAAGLVGLAFAGVMKF